ncbi:MAG: hypothetical protein IJ880_00670 [Bacilli bacterium]|nr:hypothetical protein [Bacilli bacterium]
MNIFKKIKQLFTHHKPIFTLEDELLFVLKLKLGYDDRNQKIISYKKTKKNYIIKDNYNNTFIISIDEIDSK